MSLKITILSCKTISLLNSIFGSLLLIVVLYVYCCVSCEKNVQEIDRQGDYFLHNKRWSKANLYASTRALRQTSPIYGNFLEFI